METNETLKILSILELTFQNFMSKMDSAKKKELVTVWTQFLSDQEYSIISNAVAAYIMTDTTGYAPTIGQIRTKAYDLTHEPGMTELDAWSCVLKAMGNSMYYSVEEHAKLPPEVRSSVTPEQLKDWAIVDMEKFGEVLASNFQRSFRARSKNYRENAMLPEGFRTRLAEEKENMRIEINDKGEEE